MKAIIFDLDETLIPEEAPIRDSILETCRLVQDKYNISAREFHDVIRQEARNLWRQSPVRQYCLDVGISSVEGLWGRLDGDNPELRILRDWSPQYRLNSWRNALLRYNIDNTQFAASLADAFIKNRRKHHTIYEDAEPCLKELSKSYQLGLLTNGAPCIQREKIVSVGIHKYFNEIIISGEVGYGKPDPRIYELILSHLGAKPENACVVGDRLDRDIAGAEAVGIKTIWLNRNEIQRDDSVIPDMEISSLEKFKQKLEARYANLDI